VAFEIAIETLDGKFKLSQNRPVEDRERVRAQFEGIGSANTLALAALMQSGKG